MPLFKKKIVLLTVLCVLVISIGTIVYVNDQSKADVSINKVVHTSSNSITFSEVHKLDEFAELIVIGYAADEFVDREHIVTTFDDGTMQSFHTNTDIKIEKILKKPENFQADQNEITIIEPVSLKGDVKYTADDYVELQKGDVSVLFLLRNSYGDYGLINGNLGKFSLEAITQSSVPESSTSQPLSEYATFRDSVMRKYHLNKES